MLLFWDYADDYMKQLGHSCIIIMIIICEPNWRLGVYTTLGSWLCLLTSFSIQGGIPTLLFVYWLVRTHWLGFFCLNFLSAKWRYFWRYLTGLLGCLDKWTQNQQVERPCGSPRKGLLILVSHCDSCLPFVRLSVPNPLVAPFVCSLSLD